MDFRQLETFIEVVNMKSFSKAANKLFLTQPTITSHIQNLEKELGTVLINRSSKKITPTGAGNLLYNYAVNIVNMRDTAEFKLHAYKGKIQGHLEISSSSIPKQYVLPYIIKGFIKKHPDVSVTISHNDSKKVIESILEGYNDFGIVGAKYPSKSLKYIELIEDKLMIITPNNDKYPWENYSELDLDFLLNEKIILREKGSGTRLLLENSLKEQNLDFDSLNISACIEDNETIKRFVELDLGVSVISKMAVTDQIEKGHIKGFYAKNLNLKRKFYFVYHNSRHLCPLAYTFRDYVISYIEKNGD
ncbi:MAG: LysR family transcriptional regulator [Firmicutes bacterium]|nr:LysR family transcriptional regulator [Bacillota bacterium]